MLQPPVLMNNTSCAAIPRYWSWLLKLERQVEKLITVHNLFKQHRGKKGKEEFSAVAFLQHWKGICEYQKPCISMNLSRHTAEQYNCILV